MSEKTSMNLEDIKQMDLIQIIQDMVKFSRDNPEEFRQGRLDGTDILESGRNEMYDIFVAGRIPTASEGLRVDYACVLDNLGRISLYQKR